MQPFQEESLFETSIRVHGIDWVVVFAYLDETIGGANNELTAVAAYLFDAEGVGRFRRFYQERVEPLIPLDEKRGVRMFHAAPCFDGDPPFSHLSRPIRESILALMAEAISRSVTIGVLVGIEQSEFDAGLRGRLMKVRVHEVTDSTLEPLVGSPYSLCLLRTIDGINQWIDRERLSVDGIEYVIESGDKHEREASAMLSRIAASPLGQRYRWRKHSFVRKGPDNPWLFAADYFAWTWQRNDRASLYPEHDTIGDWRTPVLPLIETKTHFVSYLTEASVNSQALINAFNGLIRLEPDA